MAPRPQGRPPFRADHVGSLLRPPALRQAFRRHAAKDIGDEEFARLQDGCIRDVVALQQDVGLQVVTDGEFRRGSYWGRFVERTHGFEIKPASFKFRNDAGHEVEFTAPYANSKIKRMQPLALDEFEFLHGVTKLTAKITLPAPSTMHFYRCNDFADKAAYKDVEFVLRRLADRVQAGDRRTRQGRLPLHPARRSRGGALMRSRHPRADRQVRQRSGRAGRSLYRQHQPGGCGLSAEM